MTTSNIDLLEIAKLLHINISVVLQEDLETEPLPIPNQLNNYIINYGNESNGGTHWVALIIYNNIAFFFDSFGAHFDSDIEAYMKRSGCNQIAYNQLIIQHLNSNLCGWYCLSFLRYMRAIFNEENRKKAFFEMANDYCNIFSDDSEKNAKKVRALILKQIKPKKLPKRLNEILFEKIIYT